MLGGLLLLVGLVVGGVLVALLAVPSGSPWRARLLGLALLLAAFIAVVLLAFRAWRPVW